MLCQQFCRNWSEGRVDESLFGIRVVDGHVHSNDFCVVSELKLVDFQKTMLGKLQQVFNVLTEKIV
jgi:hypothetical protein